MPESASKTPRKLEWPRPRVNRLCRYLNITLEDLAVCLGTTPGRFLRRYKTNDILPSEKVLMQQWESAYLAEMGGSEYLPIEDPVFPILSAVEALRKIANGEGDPKTIANQALKPYISKEPQ